MEGIYLLVGGTVDSTEDELDCWCDEFGDLESARKAMEASMPVRDACCEISHWYFVRIDQWDDEIDGWQPCEPARERVWTVLGFGSMRPDKWFSDGFEVAGPGRERVLCPDFDLRAVGRAVHAHDALRVPLIEPSVSFEPHTALLLAS